MIPSAKHVLGSGVFISTRIWTFLILIIMFQVVSVNVLREKEEMQHSALSWCYTHILNLFYY